jgi:magnesium transporter
MSDCQLYKYNKEFFAVKRESATVFSQAFVEEDLDDDYMSWLNFHGVDDRVNIESLCRKLNIDKLTMDNIFLPIRRTKLEETPHYLFFSIKSALPVANNGNLLKEDKIDFLLGKNYLISFQMEKGDHFSDVRDRIEKSRGKIRTKKADFLLFRMLEAIIDNYMEVVEHINDKIEELDKALYEHHNTKLLKEMELQKRKLIALRKIVLPMRDITIQLENSGSAFINEENDIHFRNLRSYCQTVLEEIDAGKQVLEGMTNLFYAAQGQKMNEIMRVLTVVSSIFIPLTFIVGVYGMNFENMPELKYRYGYYIIVALMIALGIGLLAFFIKRGWLKKGNG